MTIPRKVLMPLLVALGLAATVGLLVLAWHADESIKPVKTTVVEEINDDGSLTVDIRSQQEGEWIISCSEKHFHGAHEHVDKPLLDAPGGPMLVALADFEVREELQAPKRVLIEILKRHSPERIVLVAHEECLIYDSIGAWKDQPEIVRELQLKHLRQARDVLKEWFPKTEVQIYYGEKLGETQLRFFPVIDDLIVDTPEFNSPDFPPPYIELDVTLPDSSK
jgi:hypothetical protein